MTDPVADMLTRIRNANLVFHEETAMPSSKLKESLARILSLTRKFGLSLVMAVIYLIAGVWFFRKREARLVDIL